MQNALPRLIELATMHEDLREYVAGLFAHMVVWKKNYSTVLEGDIAAMVLFAETGTAQADVAKALANVSTLGPSLSTLRKAGAVSALVHLVECESARTHAARALANLSASADNVSTLLKTGAVPALVRLAAYEDARTHAARGLANLSAVPDAHPIFLEFGAVPALVRLAAYEGARTHAAHGLANLSKATRCEKALLKAAAPLFQLAQVQKVETQEQLVCVLPILHTMLTGSVAERAIVELVQTRQTSVLFDVMAFMAGLERNKQAISDCLSVLQCLKYSWPSSSSAIDKADRAFKELSSCCHELACEWWLSSRWSFCLSMCDARPTHASSHNGHEALQERLVDQNPRIMFVLVNVLMNDNDQQTS